MCEQGFEGHQCQTGEVQLCYRRVVCVHITQIDRDLYIAAIFLFYKTSMNAPPVFVEMLAPV